MNEEELKKEAKKAYLKIYSSIGAGFPMFRQGFIAGKGLKR